MKIIYKKVSELIPYVNNPRKNDKAVDAVASSIKNYGFRNAILIDAKNEIINGHTRLKAAQKLGMLEVPCVMAEDLTPSQVKGLRIADNKVAEAAEWDYDLLKIELDDIDDFTGFDLDDLNLNDKEITEDDFNTDEALENIEQPITKRGDIWRLGRHRLMCGDSTSSDDVGKLMDGNKSKLIVTDPPYNIDYTGKTNEALKIKNDNMKNADFYNFLYDVFVNYYLIADDGCGIYVFHADSEGHNFRNSFINAGFKLAQCCIWVKQTMVMGRQDYHWQHEPVLYGWKPTASHKWFSDRKQTTVWKFDRPFKNIEHPTMKPVNLVAYPIENSSKKGDVVTDFFGGSGSTLIACEQTDRICYMMELDEKYCDVIIKRWETLTGKKAEKVA